MYNTIVHYTQHKYTNYCLCTPGYLIRATVNQKENAHHPAQVCVNGARFEVCLALYLLYHSLR